MSFEKKAKYFKNRKLFKQMFAELYLPLCLYADRFLKDIEQSKDLVQDVFIKLWEKNVEISSSTTIKAFLYMAVKNACLNHIRDNKKDDLNISDIDENDLEMEQKNDWIEEDFIYNLYKAIEDLSPRSKQAVMMTVMEYSNQEIAEQMNVSVNTIKTIKYRSYKRLRENLISLASFLFFLH